MYSVCVTDWLRAVSQRGVSSFSLRELKSRAFRAEPKQTLSSKSPDLLS